MRVVRRTLQVVALVGTLVVGIVCLALIASQTPWFRDWLRKTAVRESKQYLNGELSIGGLSGNLFFGARLTDVAIDVSGERVVALKSVDVDYSVLTLLSNGITIGPIAIDSPSILLRRDATGWNLARLVKRQETEADGRGPARPIRIESIAITNGALTIDDRTHSTTYRLPARISHLDVKGAFAYEPVHYTVTLDRVSFDAAEPDFTLTQLHGAVAVRDDNLYLQQIDVQTGASRVQVDGAIEQYLRTPVLKLTAKGTATLPELARVVPPLEGYALTPEFDVKADGPLDRLGLDLDVRSGAGNVSGQVTADLHAPDLGVKGNLAIASLNLAPLVKDPAQRSDITGRGTVDLTFRSEPAAAPFVDKLLGPFTFQGPRVAAAGFQATDVTASGRFDGPRLTLDARATAYGSRGTTRGTITLPAGRRLVAYDLRGTAADVDMRRLPASIGAPALETNADVTSYHVAGSGRRVEGEATVGESTVEGATLAAGTTGTFAVNGRDLEYTARGHVSALDLQRVGRVFEIDALDTDDFASVLNGEFDVRGSGTSAAEMRIDATGTLADAAILGATVPAMTYEAHLDRGALEVQADGRVEHFDPSRLVEREDLAGQVTANVRTHFRIADVSEPMTPGAISGTVTSRVEPSTIGQVEIAGAEIDASYENRVAQITHLTVDGPDITLNASGTVGLDETTASNLAYHVEGTDLEALAAFAGQEGVGGTAVADGTLTGTRAALKLEGTLTGSDLAFQEHGALALDADYHVEIPDLRFTDATVTATSRATFVKVAGFEINEVKATTTFANQRLEFDTSMAQGDHALEAKGDVIFHPDHQEIHLPALSLRTQDIVWQMAPGGAAAVRYGARRIELDNVRLVNGDQSIDASGAFALDETADPGTLRVNAANVDLAEVDRLAGLNRNISGRFNAQTTIDGTPSEPRVAGHAEVIAGGVQNYRFESLAADVAYYGPRIGINARLQQTPTESFTVQGSVPTSTFRRSDAGHVAPAGEDVIDLQVRADSLGLGAVQGFTNVITNVTGVVNASVHVGGAAEDPHLNGYIEIKGAGFGVPSTGVSYTGVDSRIELTPERVHIPGLRIVDEEGEALEISGDLAVHERGLGAVNITVSSRNFELIDNELGDVGVETALKITGELRRPVVEGNIRVQTARLEVDRILAFFYDPYSLVGLPEVPSAERVAEASPSAEQATRDALAQAQDTIAPVPPLPAFAAALAAAPAAQATVPAGGAFGPVALRVTVRIPDNMVLRGRNLRPGGPTGTAIGNINITVGGNLDIRKEADRPVILLGTIEAVRGTYEFQGRRFDLVRGAQVRFTGEERINPILDISATRTIPNTGVEATVRITGSAQAPELRLSSTPPLDESDILALIIFNRPVNELGSGERTSLAATAGGIATGFIAQPLGQTIGRALDLDIFEITTSTAQGDLGAGITVGQQIGDRTFLRLQQQFGERLSSEFMLEYQIAEFLRLQASGAPETTGSANRIGQRRIEHAGINLVFFFSY